MLMTNLNHYYMTNLSHYYMFKNKNISHLNEAICQVNPLVLWNAKNTASKY